MYCVYIRDDSGDLDGEIDLPTWERAEQAVARLAVRGRRDATTTGRCRSVYAIDIDWHGPHCATGQCQGGTDAECRTIDTRRVGA